MRQTIPEISSASTSRESEVNLLENALSIAAQLLALFYVNDPKVDRDVVWQPAIREYIHGEGMRARSEELTRALKRVSDAMNNGDWFLPRSAHGKDRSVAHGIEPEEIIAARRKVSRACHEFVLFVRARDPLHRVLLKEDAWKTFEKQVEERIDTIR